MALGFLIVGLRFANPTYFLFGFRRFCRDDFHMQNRFGLHDFNVIFCESVIRMDDGFLTVGDPASAESLPGGSDFYGHFSPFLSGYAKTCRECTPYPRSKRFKRPFNAFNFF
jgi:hypothetical protein